MMRRAAILIALLTACTSARDVAQAKLGKEAQCIGSTGKLAYCTVRGAGFICDTSDCVPAPNAAHVLLELEEERQSDEDTTNLIIMGGGPR
jgi:hypothetical protein